MRHVRLELSIPSRRPAAVYVTLADFGRYAEFAPAVRSVVVTHAGDRTTVSRWEVNFRKGILRWVEEDTFDPDEHRIAFRQLEGDIALFEGSWHCTAAGEGTRITFDARLDMGIPSLADALEPIAARTLVDNTVAIVSGIFLGESVVEQVLLDGIPQLTEAAGARQ
ncbi:MAG: type II toxin-antitoxin system RatA family toxin [Acidimicrobiales bacterium]